MGQGLVEGNGTGGVVRVEKQPAFLETGFRVDRLPGALPSADERLLLIGTVTMVLLERQRG